MIEKYSCHISTQIVEAIKPSLYSLLKVSPQGTQDGGRMSAIKPSDPEALPPTQCSPRALRLRKHRTLAPDNWGVCQRSDFREPRSLHFLLYRKALNVLTWDIRFPLINSNNLMFRLPSLCCKNSSYVSWLLPSLSRAVPQRYLWACILGLGPQFCPLNKI